jgi:hypothetical protein
MATGCGRRGGCHRHSLSWVSRGARQDDGRYLGYVGLVSRRISGPELARMRGLSTLIGLAR